MGPFTGNGGSGAGGGAGGAAADAGYSTVPVARDDAYELNAEAVSTVPAAGVLANDELNGAEIVELSLPTRLGGSVQLTQDGSFVYTPPADPGPLPRLDDFTYTLRSADGESSATVVLGLFGTPTAADDHYGTPTGTDLVLDAPGVLENDDPGGAVIASYDLTSAAGGSVVLESSGALVYAAPDGFAGEDSFLYTLRNVAGESTAMVVIQVGSEPLAADDSFIGSKGAFFTPPRSVLDNDSLGLPDAQIVSFGGGSLGGSAGDHPVGTTATVGGSSVTLTTDGLFSFQPDAALVGPFEFLYRLENASGVSEGSVVIELHEAPLAVDDEFELLAGSTLTVAAAQSLLSNDVGTPAPVITSFGGGSLGGTVADHAVPAQGSGTTVDTGLGLLTINADGSVSYQSTPEASGVLSFDYHIENAAGSDEGTVTITVNHAPEITSPDELTLRAGTADNLPFELTATGTPEPTISIDGELPDGITFSDGSLVGSAGAESGGTYEVTVTAENGIEPAAEQLLFITVETQAVLTGEAEVTFTVGSAASYVPTLVGGVPSPTLTLSGTLPDGVVFDSQTGALSGIPAQESGGTYLLEITASNGIGAPVVLSLTLEVLEAPEITSAESATFEVGEPGSFQVEVSSNPESTLNVLGELPVGVTFDPVTGTLEGTPAVGQGGEHFLAFEASNGVNPEAFQDFTLFVNEAPGLSGGATASFVIGSAGTYTATATGYPAPTLSLSGALPAGLSFDGASGTLSGTPAEGSSGSYPVTIGADNGIGSAASLSVTIDVREVSLITSANSTTFTAGLPGSFQVTASGTPAPALSLLGTLPGGVTFSEATGTLAGTPASGTGGIYPLTFTADNGVGAPGSQTFTLTVAEAPGLLGAATVTFVVGESNTYTTTRSGFPLPGLVLDGELPDGLTFDALTGTISGTAEPGTGGTYPLTLTASNGVLIPATLSLTLTVEEGGAFTSDDETTFTVGTAGTFTVTATGTPAPTLSVVEPLPDGITFTPGTGELAGTPAAGTGGTYELTFLADNGVGTAASQTFTLTINEAPSLLGAPTTTFVVATPGSYTPGVLGFPAPELSLTGSLPGGLSFNTETGAITGTAQAGTGGSYPVTIGATNGIGSAASLAVTISVQQAAQITSANATTFTVGSAGSFSVTASGTPAPTFSVSSGSLPSGVTLSSGGSLSGTPVAGTGGTYPITLSATNGVGSPATQAFTLTVNEAPSLSGAPTASFQVAQSGSYSVTSSGFPAPTLGLTGSLPSGLSFSGATGTISGTPGAGTAGSYPVTIGADNGIGAVASLGVTITVSDPATITSAAATTFSVGSPGSFQVTASGTPAPTLSLSGSLPPGVTFSAVTGVLSGTPAAGAGGTYSLTIGADNGVGTPGSQSFTLTVLEAPSISGAPPSPVNEDAPYLHSFLLGGFPAPTTAVVSGTLPSGLTLSSAGVLSGTPTTPGTSSNITVRATNVVSVADITFDIVVNVAALPPAAVNDSFAATGNIPIDVPVGSSVLNNDTLNTATLTGFGPSIVTASAQVPGGTSATVQGGSVTLAADGSFTYDPPAAVTGTDSFAYTVSNAGGSSVGIVTITITNRVWFVDAAAAGGGNGKATAPFQALTNVTSTASGDVIYALRSASPYAAKTLSAGQRLLGQGITVTPTHLGFTPAPFARSSVFGAAGASSTMRTLTLASNVYVRGFDVSALSGTSGLVGASVAGVDIAGMAVSASNATAVTLSSTAGTISLRSVTSSGGVNGISLVNTTGSFTVTGSGSNLNDGSGGTIASATNDGIRLNNAQNVSLSSLSITPITTGFYGIHGNGVNNLSLQGVTTSGGAQGLMFEDNNGNPANLTGTVVIRNSSFANHTTLIGLQNSVGTISSFILEDNTFSTATSAGISLQILGNAVLSDMSVKRNTFTSVSTTLLTNAFNLLLSTDASSSTTLTPFAKVTMENNTFTGSNGTPIRMRVLGTNGTLHAIVRNNTVSGITGTNVNAMRVDSGNSGGNSVVCLQVQNNSFTPTGTAQGIAVRRDQSDTFGIVGLTPSPSTVATDITTFINGQNPGNTSQVITGATAFASGYTSCTIP